MEDDHGCELYLPRVVQKVRSICSVVIGWRAFWTIVSAVFAGSYCNEFQSTGGFC
jgi:hypothetical protein